MAARKLTVYSAARAELVAFEKKYNTLVVDCSTPVGMKAAKDSRKEIRDARSNLEDLRKETKEPVLDKGRQIDAEAKAISEVLTTLFTKFDGAIKAIENKAEIDKQKALDDALAKVKDLEDREAAIIAKEIELGLRQAPAEDRPVESLTDDGDTVASPDTTHLNASSANKQHLEESVAELGDKVETICQPHIEVGNTRLAALKAIRNLIEPTDPQPESGEIDDKIATNHDQVLADVWELVDEYQ